MMKILNLTDGNLTSAHISAGVYNLSGPRLWSLYRLLTFSEVPTKLLVNSRARRIAQLAKREKPKFALIGSVPFLIVPLVRELENVKIVPIYEVVNAGTFVGFFSTHLGDVL